MVMRTVWFIHEYSSEVVTLEVSDDYDEDDVISEAAEILADEHGVSVEAIQAQDIFVEEL